MSVRHFRFEGRLTTLVYPGKYRYLIVRLPRKLVAALPFAEQIRVRVSGSINGHAFDGAWLPAGDAAPYLILSARWVAAAGLKVDDVLDVRFKVEPADHVVVPEELAVALEGSREATANWNQLTPGRRRGLAYQVGKAKLSATRERRAADLVERLKGGTWRAV